MVKLKRSIQIHSLKAKLETILKPYWLDNMQKKRQKLQILKIVLTSFEEQHLPKTVENVRKRLDVNFAENEDSLVKQLSRTAFTKQRIFDKWNDSNWKRNRFYFCLTKHLVLFISNFGESSETVMSSLLVNSSKLWKSIKSLLQNIPKETWKKPKKLWSTDIHIRFWIIDAFMGKYLSKKTKLI